jgi:hypothetical protein
MMKGGLMHRRQALLSTSVGCVALWISAATAPATAAGVSPPLGTAGSYMVLGTNSIPTSGTVTCTDTGPGGNLDGNVGTTFTSITNTGCTITGTIDAPVAGAVVTDFGNAHSALASLNPTCDGVIPTTSTTIPPGVYCSAAGTTVGAGVTFTLDGDATDVWIFKVGTSGLGALTGNSFQVVMGGQAQPCNVFWWTAEAATMTDSNFIGSILAGSAVSLTRGDYLGRVMATTDATVTDVAPMTFAGCAAPSTITVHKEFLPDNVASVPVVLTCTSGLIINSQLSASEALPAVFDVGGAAEGATCTATEIVPIGYTADQSGCVNVPLGGSCTIVNTLLGNTVTVNKDFFPDSLATVEVDLACTSGTVANGPLLVSETAPGIFLVNGAGAQATCTATETVPLGYTADETNCLDVPLGGSCTITNTQLSVVAIPTLSNWSMILLAMLLGLAGFAVMRRRTI